MTAVAVGLAAVLVVFAVVSVAAIRVAARIGTRNRSTMTAEQFDTAFHGFDTALRASRKDQS